MEEVEISYDGECVGYIPAKPTSGNNSSEGDRLEDKQESEQQKQQHLPSIKSGWLIKQGGVVKNWLRRWFTIKGNYMYYYTNKDEKKLLGAIPLPGNKVAECPFNPDKPGKFLFEISPGKIDGLVALISLYL